MDSNNKKKGKAWLKGGIIGALVCLALGLFYVAVYFPIVENDNGSLPNKALALPLVTGHVVPLFSGFIIPHDLFCPKTEVNYSSWMAKGVPGLETDDLPECVPMVKEGVDGCAYGKYTSATIDCAHVSEKIVTVGSIVLLFVVYFVLGSIIALIIEKKKNAK